MGRKGFTLLELLLAVAILGVLLGLLLWYLEPLSPHSAPLLPPR
ncbi:type II secretion system protein [Thermus scotoductus]|nr:type II secretion system protein [Thermus scotoductus]